MCNSTFKNSVLRIREINVFIIPAGCMEVKGDAVQSAFPLHGRLLASEHQCTKVDEQSCRRFHPDRCTDVLPFYRHGALETPQWA